jgi:hypothetical protein
MWWSSRLDDPEFVWSRSDEEPSSRTVDPSTVKEDMSGLPDSESGFDQTRALFEEKSIAVSRLEDRGNSRCPDPTHGTGDGPRIEVSRSSPGDEFRIMENIAEDRQCRGPAKQGWIASSIESPDPDHDRPFAVPAGGHRIPPTAAGSGLRSEERQRGRDIRDRIRETCFDGGTGRR